MYYANSDIGLMCCDIIVLVNKTTRWIDYKMNSKSMSEWNFINNSLFFFKLQILCPHTKTKLKFPWCIYVIYNEILLHFNITSLVEWKYSMRKAKTRSGVHKSNISHKSKGGCYSSAVNIRLTVNNKNVIFH